MGNLNDEKSLIKIATTIFMFEIGASCSITGFAPDADDELGVSPRGKQVLALLKGLYDEKYVRPNYRGTGNTVRTRIHLTNSIGGAVAHPIWRYKIEITENPKNVKYNIWRIQ